ncbi:MAG TPA: HAMP domain-containing sensor histidine kinase, partial [Miltoncostaeaceae bacterium]|nr:HAMP domain-containing sensor histidine kinase [Miltoncostaeaceae bacterium]
APEDLLALASEELRGPLTSVVGYLQVLLDGEVGELTPGQARMAEVAARNAQRMEHLVDDLIVVAEVLSGGMSAAPAPVDLAALVRDRAAAAAPGAAARGVRLAVAADGPVMLAGDAPALVRMVDQMIAGSLAFCPAAGRVVVRLACWRDGRVRLDVADEPPPGDAPVATGPARAMLASRLGPALIAAVARGHGGAATPLREGDPGAVRVELPASSATGMRVV